VHSEKGPQTGEALQVLSMLMNLGGVALPRLRQK
jgi:hypothetical protein